MLACVLKCKNGRMGQEEAGLTTLTITHVQSAQYLTIYH
jgi:hypothetical protein